MTRIRGHRAPEPCRRAASFHSRHRASASAGRCTSAHASAAEVAERPTVTGADGADVAAQPQASTSSAGVDAPRIPLPTSSESDTLLRIRHSCAHVMAMAMQRVHPGTQVTLGPAIERGFYYDFDMSKAEKPFTDKVMKKAQKEMRRLIRKDLPLAREEVSAHEARRRIRELGEPYKLEILNSILERDPDAAITIYHIGRAGEKEHWWDLCAGPHVTSTGAIDAEAVELERSAGAYWRGDEGAAQLTRVYGTAWESGAQLAAYREFQEEAARRDHRKLGAQLGLFSLQEEAGGGLVFWQPHGAAMRNVIEAFWKELHVARGYDLLYTPHIAKADLWKTSGHYDFYGENMYDQMQVEDESYQLRPMNCPFHVLTFKQGFYSYRDLPLRWAELGTVYRYERSGTMHGLFRVRGFTQDDGHIFCTPDQIQPEIRGFLDLVEAVLDKFGFTKFEVNLSTRPEGSIGSDAVWERAETALKEALDDKGWPYVEDIGGGAFYGPKIDIKIEDAIGRMWQCSTMQLDFNLPERFDIHYVDADNAKARPIMLHRAIFGSIERFFGILIENFAGAFPAWLAPVQCRLLPVNTACEEFCWQLRRRMKDRGIRVDLAAGEKLGKGIRNAELAKIPVVAVIGPRDIEAGVASVRTFADGEVGQIQIDDLVERLVATNTSRSDFDTSGIAAAAAAAA